MKFYVYIKNMKNVQSNPTVRFLEFTFNIYIKGEFESFLGWRETFSNIVCISMFYQLQPFFFFFYILNFSDLQRK